MKPRISFVMPNRDRARFIPDAVSTILQQTLQDIELVFVDDDSSDDSKDIIKALAKRDKRIRPIFLDPIDENTPIASRIDRGRNIGNQHARANIICTSSSDDWYYPNRAQLTYDAFQKDKALGLFYGSYTMKDIYGGHKYIKDANNVFAQKFSMKDLKETGFFFIGHFTVGYKRELILKYPYDDPEVCVGDWGMFYNMIIRGKAKLDFTEKIICAYRVLGNAYKQQENLDFSKYMYKKKMQRLKELGDLCN